MRVTVQTWGFDRLAGEVRDVLEGIKGRSFFRSHAPLAWTPRVNLYETAEHYIVCAELAGICHSEIDVRAESGVLRIQGVRRKPDLPDECRGKAQPLEMGVHLMEIDSGRFFRELPIASDVEVGKITALYRRGYLWVLLPRLERTGQLE